MDPQQLILNLVVTLIPLILAITVHEFAHIAMARWLGDDLGTRMGRYNLNPLSHIDPIWTVALPAILVVMSGGGAALPFFAAGKPAPYNPVRLDRRFGGKRITLRNAELLVAAAGPLSNIALALVCMIALAVVGRAGVDITDPFSPLALLPRFVVLNLALFVFNLIPIPPLDGSKVVYALLPTGLAERYEAVATRLSWVLLVAVIVAGGVFIGPIVGGLYRLMAQLL